MEAAPRKDRVGAFGLRFLVAHLVAYPVAVVWMVAAIPVAFPVFERRLAETTGATVLAGVPMDAEVAVVVRFALVVGAVAFALAHLVGVVWGLARDDAAGRRRFVRDAIALGGLGGLAAAGAWLWFLVRYG